MQKKKKGTTESQYDVTVKYSQESKKIKRPGDLKKQKITTYLLSVYCDLLKEMSDRKRITMTKLINQAVDEFLQNIGRIDGPLTPPISKDYLQLKPDQEDS